MLKQILSLLVITTVISCTSANKESLKENEIKNEMKKDEAETPLSKEKAKELIMEKMDTPEGNVGGTFTDVKEIDIQSIEEKESIYTVKFTWSGTVDDPSTPPEEGEDTKDYNKNRHHKITNEKEELKVRMKGDNWIVLN